jgi:hypothetical protein
MKEMARSIRRPFAIGILAATAVIAAAVARRYLVAADLIEADSGRRLVQVVVGLALAVHGNFMPKGYGTAAVSACATGRAQSALRIGGWAMALAGLVYAGLWSFAPLPWADGLSDVVVGAAVLVTAFALWTLASRRPRPNTRMPV